MSPESHEGCYIRAAGSLTFTVHIGLSGLQREINVLYLAAFALYRRDSTATVEGTWKRLTIRLLAMQSAERNFHSGQQSASEKSLVQGKLCNKSNSPNMAVTLFNSHP
jgi:hypothetical protein